MIIAPNAFDPTRYPERNAERVARIERPVAGQCQPKGLFELLYGKLGAATRKEAPPLSCFSGYSD